MKFISKEEITSLVKLSILNDVTEENNNLLDVFESVALSEIDSYIGNKYNTTETFNRKGTERNQFLINIVIDILLYHLHSRLTPDQIPLIRTQRYEKAIAWLYQVSIGKITPPIPLNVLPFNSRSSESLFGYTFKTNNENY